MNATAIQPAVSPEPSGILSGREMVAQFIQDHETNRTIEEERHVIPIVAFASEHRAVALFISEVGGFLTAWNGTRCEGLQVHEALSWYRANIAENWFTLVNDNYSSPLMTIKIPQR